MDDQLKAFERVARALGGLSYQTPDEEGAIEHPFEFRNIHPALPTKVRTLFDDGHYPQATFEAFKFIDKEIARLASNSESGEKLMMKVFSEDNPLIKLTPCSTTSQKDEQRGFKFLFAGSIVAIRNPRGHEYDLQDSPDECLDHLAVASVLLRRLESAGFKITVT